jgi:sugar phosphate isomerase/epimerase
MRYGIMAMQIGALIPPGLPPENILAHIAGFEHAGLVQNLADQGFNLIELGGDLVLFLPHTFSKPEMDKLAALKAERGLDFTLHLPLWSVEPSTPLQPVRQGSVRAVVESINASRGVEPEMYVLHATGALAAEFFRMRGPEAARALLMRQFQSAAGESIRTILRETGIPSRKLAIETIEFPLNLTLELADDLDLSICFDTGHILAGFSGAEDFFEALERCLPRLGEVHLHDSPWRAPNDTPAYGMDHQVLGHGDLDLDRFLARLEEARFEGPVIFELTVEQALESLRQVDLASGQGLR